VLISILKQLKMKIKQLIILLPLLCLHKIIHAQQNVGIGTNTPNASAILEIRSNTKGLLIPRVPLISETDVATITNPAISLLIYNTNTMLPDGEGHYFWNGTKWSRFATRSNLANLAWGTAGNAGTNATTDFIGTIDDKPLIFKTNNIESGRIDPQPNNVFFGRGAGKLTTGVNNSFFGHQSGSANSLGVENTAMGSFALESNTTGTTNTAIGLSALRSNNTGDFNTAVGSRALFANETGSRNVGIGRHSLQSGTDVTDCIAIGHDALSSLVHGSALIAIGSGALQNATFLFVDKPKVIGIGFNALFNNRGVNNIALGHQALTTNFTGESNVGIGVDVLKDNITGSFNTSIGHSSMINNRSGELNTALGNGALFDNSSGSRNTAIGSSALSENTGDNNTAVGNRALFFNTTGSNNTAIGAEAFPPIGFQFLTNSTMIGYQATATTSNTMVFGNSNVDKWAFGITTTGPNHALQVGNNSTNGNGAFLTQGGTWTNTSSQTKKEDFSDVDGLELLQKIQQMSVRKWKYKGTNEYHIGPVAEDFYKLFGLGMDDKGISTVDPAGIALAAIQEQQRIIEKQNEQINQLQKRIEAIEKK
jgi:trimeric autotransporter adhesin